MMTKLLSGFVLALCLSLSLASPAGAQITFEQAVSDLKSSDAAVRLAAVRMLKEAAYPEAAVPLASNLVDPDDEVQFEAIAAELNIFLAEKVVPKRRMAFLVEVRNTIAAEAAFSAGSTVLGLQPVPVAVLAGLRAATHDENPRVALEALYAFGTLAVEPRGDVRHDLLRAAGPELGAILGSARMDLRLAAVRVVGRVFAQRPFDEPVDQTVGDLVIGALNDKSSDIRVAAAQALGAMRYQGAIEALTDAFRLYGRGVIGQAAFEALAHIAHASSSSLFTAQLTNKNSALKKIAIEGLSRLGDPAHADDIQSALAGEGDETVILAARFSDVKLSNGSIDPLVEELARGRNHDQAFGYLIEIVPGHVRQFSRAAQDPDTRLRSDIANALGLSGDSAALAIVEPMIRDRDPQVARAAERAVARLRAAAGRAS